MTGPIKQNYFINNLTQNSLNLIVEQEDASPKQVEIQMVGLTLNSVYDNMYDFFDEIIETIQ